MQGSKRARMTPSISNSTKNLWYHGWYCTPTLVVVLPFIASKILELLPDNSSLLHPPQVLPICKQITFFLETPKVLVVPVECF